MKEGLQSGILMGVALILFHLVPSSARSQENSLERQYAAAQQKLAAGDVQQARAKLKKLVQENPNVAEIHATLGAVEFQLGDYAAALAELQRALNLKPTLPELKGLIAMSQAELGQFEEALPQLVETFRISRDPAINRLSGLQLERAYTAMRQDADAVAVALEMQKQFPNDAEVLYHNERIFGNFAYQTVEKLVAVAPDSIWRHRAQAEVDESQASWDAAIEEYRGILAVDPKHPGIHYRIGRCLRERARDSHHPDDLQEAGREFSKELAIDLGSANAAYEIGELHRLVGELEPARVAFEQALKNYPNFPEANLGLGTVLTSLNQPAAALPYLKAATVLDPDDEACWWRLSQAQRMLGQVTEQQASLAMFRSLHDRPEKRQAVGAREVSHQQVETE